METTAPFIGLPLPVFSAFGWAGEAQAVKYAVEQLEQFIVLTHATMGRDTQTILPHRGYDATDKSVFLGRDLETAQNLYITYMAKPMALRTSINLTNRTALQVAFKTIQKQHDAWIKALGEMGENWEVRFQKMEYNPETGEAVHYEDLYNDKVAQLTASTSAELVDTMLYLNSEDKWIVPITFMKKASSEFVSAMGASVTDVMAKELDDMLVLLRLLTGSTAKAKSGAKATKKTTTVKKKSKATSASAVAENKAESFTYSTTIKPIHLRKGFINLTPAHWPFFSLSARASTRDVTLIYDGHVDKAGSVWRLVEDDRARLVLSDKAHKWVEDNFTGGDQIQLTATKTGSEIEIKLELVQ